MNSQDTLHLQRQPLDSAQTQACKALASVHPNQASQHRQSNYPRSVRVISCKLNGLERMCIDRQASPSSRPSHEIMSRISNDETDVVLLHEEDARLDVCCCLGEDDVLGLETECAGTRGWSAGASTSTSTSTRETSASLRWIAGVVSPECPEGGGRLIGAISQVNLHPLFRNGEYVLPLLISPHPCHLTTLGLVE